MDSGAKHRTRGSKSRPVIPRRISYNAVSFHSAASLLFRVCLWPHFAKIGRTVSMRRSASVPRAARASTEEAGTGVSFGGSNRTRLSPSAPTARFATVRTSFLKSADVLLGKMKRSLSKVSNAARTSDEEDSRGSVTSAGCTWAHTVSVPAICGGTHKLRFITRFSKTVRDVGYVLPPKDPANSKNEMTASEMGTHHCADPRWSSGQPSGGLAPRRRVRPSGRFSFSAAFSCRLLLRRQVFQTQDFPSRAAMSPALWRE